MDWTGCEQVERIEGKVSGQPLVVGSRIPADFIWNDARSGMTPEQIQADYPSLSLQEIRSVIAFAVSHQSAA